MANSMGVQLRAATQDDLSFLLELRRRTMTRHEAAVGRVRTQSEVAARVLADFESAQVITHQGQPIGLLKVIRSGNSWELAQMQVEPGYQGRGIGSDLLERVSVEARCCGAELTLSVLKTNPALRLYERGGFEVVGESAVAYKMRMVER